MHILSLDVGSLRFLNATTGGAVYRYAATQLLRQREPELIVVRVPPVPNVPVRWFLTNEDGDELVELHDRKARAIAVHIHLLDESTRLERELADRIAIEEAR